MKRTLLAGVAMLACTSYAAAADFYVVQDTTSKRCSVVEQKPTGTAMVIVGGDGRVFTTREAAEAALKAENTCNQMAQAPGAPGAPAAGNVRLMSEVPSNSVTMARYYKQNVYDGSNNKIGDIDDVLVNAEGRINALVIGVGGFLGIGEKHVIAPFNAVKGSFKDTTWQLVMNSSKDELKAAPGFKYDRTKATWLRDESKQ